MKKLTLWLIAFVMLFPTVLRAQNLSGDWQGTLNAGGKDLRIIFSISLDDKEHWIVKMYSIDQTPQPIPTSAVKVDGASFSFKVDLIGGSYDGKIAPDHKTISGTWTQGNVGMPLTLVLATPETAWGIPTPPAPEKPMAADADPSFDVATIKPNPSGGASIQQLTLRMRNFVVRNGSLNDLIGFAYNVRDQQIVGAPGWANGDRYDVDAVPDQPGQPNMVQLRSMVRKLLADRYQLKFHHEQREMSAYVLSAGKTGQKLTPTTTKGELPGFFASPGTGGLTMHLVNGTMADFAGFLQMLVLDKPVVDQTAISGKFDENVTFTPDLSQFHGNPPKLPPADVPDAPDLFTAIQQQLGLRLAAEKTPVDVIVIDQVAKPSPN